MCGIAGLWNHSWAGERAAARLKGMLDAMAHRGPDGRGTLELPGTAAGMVRLALLDPTARGQQPIWTEDRQIAVLFNGEIYNFRQERARLEARGYRFRTSTDTEVILALYQHEGLDFVQRLRGMFALALFDRRHKLRDQPPTLILARDPFGIKPLYLQQPTASSLAFASELKGLMALPEVPRQVDHEALAQYLSFGAVHQPRTMLEGVRMLEPACVEVYEVHEAKLRRREHSFWRLPPYRPRKESLAEAAERLRGTLEESIALHAFADVPVGAFLSGGIDSTGMVALMRPHLNHLRTYTLRFPEFAPDDGLDEAAEAQTTAHNLDCEHNMVEIRGQEVADLLPTFVGDLDQPSTDGLNTWLISRRAAQDVKGVLSGLGGDEFFAGYPVTRRMAHLQGSPVGKALTCAGHLAQLGVRLGCPSQRLQGFAARRSTLSLWLRGHTVFPPDEARRLAGLSPLAADRRWQQRLSRWFPDWRQESAVGLSCLLDMRAYMGHQLLRDADAAGMAWSLELRVPFVDREMVAFSRSCRDVYKLANDGGASLRYQDSGAKRVLLESLRDRLPPELARRPKRGFALPYGQWLTSPATPLGRLAEELCPSRGLVERGLLDPRSVAAFQRRLPHGRQEDLYPRLWSLMILELWCRRYLDTTTGG